LLYVEPNSGEAIAARGNVSHGPLTASYKQFSDGPRVSEARGKRRDRRRHKRDVGQAYSVGPSVGERWPYGRSDG